MEGRLSSRWSTAILHAGPAQLTTPTLLIDVMISHQNNAC